MTQSHEIAIALRAAYLALHRQSESAFSKYHVTADQFVLLVTLHRGGHALTQRELAQRMSSDPSTVRAMLVLLERRGLVKRDSHPTDCRARMVSLTVKGKQTVRQLWSAGEPIRHHMHSVLAPQESQLLVELLSRISTALEPDRHPQTTPSSSHSPEDDV